MVPSDQARKHHDDLFPGHVSTLAVTDPELIEIFDNFTFDEVLRASTLGVRTRLMIQLAALIASQAAREYRVMVGAALTVGVTPVEIKEIVYQAVPYVGMAKVFDFLHVTNEVLTEQGVDCPCLGSPRPRRRLARNSASTSRSRSSVARPSSSSTRTHPPTSNTSSASCRLIALVITSPAPVSTCRCASSSPSACSWRSGDATHKCGAMLQPTSMWATTVAG